jgi:acetyltransferase
MLSNTPGRAADLDALALTLIKVSQLVIDIGEITALDINPLWVGPESVIALDASIQVAAYTLAKPTDRLAITPYPKELEQEIVLPDGRALLLRPITAEDEPAVQAMVRRADPEDLRLRFFQSIRELSHAMGARLTQLDYDREMAFAITDSGLPGKADIWGVVRINADPDLEKAEYAILLDRTMMGLGLGPMLMRHIIEYARKRGIREIFGEVLRENRPMLKLNRALGFKVATDPEDQSLMLVRLKL